MESSIAEFLTRRLASEQPPTPAARRHLTRPRHSLALSPLVLPSLHRGGAGWASAGERWAKLPAQSVFCLLENVEFRPAL